MFSCMMVIARADLLGKVATKLALGLVATIVSHTAIVLISRIPPRRRNVHCTIWKPDAQMTPNFQTTRLIALLARRRHAPWGHIGAHSSLLRASTS